MQTFYAIVNKSGGYRFLDYTPPEHTDILSTYVVNDEAEITVYWPGRTVAELTDALVVPVHDMLMDAVTGRNGKGKVS